MNPREIPAPRLGCSGLCPPEDGPAHGHAHTSHLWGRAGAEPGRAITPSRCQLCQVRTGQQQLLLFLPVSARRSVPDWGAGQGLCSEPLRQQAGSTSPRKGLGQPGQRCTGWAAGRKRGSWESPTPVSPSPVCPSLLRSGGPSHLCGAQGALAHGTRADSRGEGKGHGGVSSAAAFRAVRAAQPKAHFCPH